MSDNIDFIVPAVDGNDPDWRAKKNKYLGIDEGDDRDIRYRSWDNLQYWFRAVEKFAPWVNRVFLVTDGQVPEWINRDCEKLVLVDHKDFIPEEYLPVFSSHPIELNAFRIDGLSEQFVLFNDDVFLTKPVSPDQFFKNGLPCDYAIEAPIAAHDRTFAHILINNVLMLNENYQRKEVLKKQKKKFYSPVSTKGMLENLALMPLKRNMFFGFKNSHAASALLKSSCEAVWKENFRWLDETCRNRFRNDNDVNQYVFLNYQYVNGIFEPYDWKDRRHLYRVTDNDIDRIAADIINQKYTQICINEANELDFDRAKTMINGAFDKLLPDRSSFEKMS